MIPLGLGRSGEEPLAPAGHAGPAVPEDQMKEAVDSGWLPQTRRVPSPNHDRRPPGCAVDLLVIHGISLPAGELGGPWIDALFQNRLSPTAHPSFAGLRGLRVSAHLLIQRDGELVQYVPLHLRAWHAGRSRFRGRDGCNDFSIGIELEGTDTLPYTDAQYVALTRVTGILMGLFPAITRDRITGHSDIAPGRKTDPGPAFDWTRYLSTLET
jgi:N-acetyl-anhydromuramoyl-L-alanine amidase